MRVWLYRLRDVLERVRVYKDNTAALSTPLTSVRADTVVCQRPLSKWLVSLWTPASPAARLVIMRSRPTQHASARLSSSSSPTQRVNNRLLNTIISRSSVAIHRSSACRPSVCLHLVPRLSGPRSTYGL